MLDRSVKFGIIVVPVLAQLNEVITSLGDHFTMEFKI